MVKYRKDGRRFQKILVRGKKKIGSSLKKCHPETTAFLAEQESFRQSRSSHWTGVRGVTETCLIVAGLNRISQMRSEPLNAQKGVEKLPLYLEREFLGSRLNWLCRKELFFQSITMRHSRFCLSSLFARCTTHPLFIGGFPSHPRAKFKKRD